MGVDDWMVKGYLAAFTGAPHEPPNYYLDAAAYEHGWRSGEDDRSGKPRGTIAVKRERVANMHAAELAEQESCPTPSPAKETERSE